MGNLVKLDFIPKFYLLITDVTWKFLRPSPLAPLSLGEGMVDVTFLLKCLALHPICLKTLVVLKVRSSI